MTKERAKAAVRGALKDFDAITCDVTAAEWFVKHANSIGKDNVVTFALRYLEAALDEGWQDIESAPKDDYESILAKCVSNDGSWEEVSVVPAHAVRSILIPDLHFHYTHWKPLTPPTEKLLEEFIEEVE